MPNSYLEPSNWLVRNFLSKSDEILILGPIGPNLYFFSSSYFTLDIKHLTLFYFTLDIKYIYFILGVKP